MKNFQQHLGWVERIWGLPLVVTGVLFLIAAFARVSYWMIELFPGLAEIG